MRNIFLSGLLSLDLVLTACSGGAEMGAAAPDGAGAGTSKESAGTAKNLPSASASQADQQPECSDYRTDLSPRDVEMIYHAIAGIEPPWDQWTEQVLTQSPRTGDAEQDWNRASSQVKSQWAAVSPIRCLSLHTTANIRRYDPARGGLIVDAISPDRYFTFNNVDLRLVNAQEASLIAMDSNRAKALTAGSGLWGAGLDIKLGLTGARPSGAKGILEGRVSGLTVASSYQNSEPIVVEYK